MILLLSRARPLTPAEIRALPAGCQALDGKDGLVARAEVDLPAPQLLGFAVTMGRAVPDAIFVAQESQKAGVAAPAVAAAPSAASAAAPAAAASAASTPAAPAAPEAVLEHDPWKLVDAGKLADAERVFTSLGEAVTGPARDRVRTLFSDADPAKVALGCRLVRILGMRSQAVAMRGLLTHAHPDVRAAAVEAVSHIAGPSMAPAVAALQNDPDAAVRAAAATALARLGG